MIPFAIAGVQMHVGAMRDNTQVMVQKVDLVMASFPWVQMIVFSELAACGPLPHAPQTLPGAHLQTLAAAAARHGVWIVNGSNFEMGEDGRIYNTASVIDANGHVIRHYRKMFPFRPYERDVSAGTGFCVFDVPDVGRFGLSICYDLWFPETTRTLTAMGAEVLLHPVLTRTIDRDVEIAMARAAAAQFQCFVFDINGLAAGGIGRSCVFSPSGSVLHQAGGQDEIIPIEVDLEQVRRQRERGMFGLGQVLKSFRDREVEFSVYDRNSGTDAFLHTLGPLHMPDKGGRAGIGTLAPAQTLQATPHAPQLDDPATG
ncbi:carbon-nitrogen hydrolase family protein [Oleiagrimonas sp.]|jgi:predicted amidohydrolase|uniref:carbon-nitrogen hydrolase family protein n=1 Tax=Oleiagrimonas sp. TaxID=2010330 RepID=UPI00260D7BC6|nr:carbon-nitrogen hydrolase family protein [Oleiagrimonas sp.]MDA3914233.1 carbon-nitrogen hydrolase family protein [Oleiagrimonas sp.]